MIYLHWHRSANFGDRLAKIIAQHFHGDVVDWSGQDTEHYMLTGSIANHATPKTVIWGAGVANYNDIIPKCEIPMIRGELSKRIAEEGGSTVGDIGDPVLAMPQIYNPVVEKKYSLGIIPHVIEYLGIATRYMDYEDIKVIDLCKHPYEVIQDILSCEKTISSSLHGLIASHAYGVPSEWVLFSNNVVGNGFKFYDYFTSVGIDEHEPIDLRHYEKKIIVPNYDIKHNVNFKNVPFV